MVGGTDNIPDVLVVVASDDHAYLSATVKWLEELAFESGLTVLYRDNGSARTDEPGHEQFGFDDGVSQPGVRGRVSDAPNDYPTDRYIDTGDPLAA